MALWLSTCEGLGDMDIGELVFGLAGLLMVLSATTRSNIESASLINAGHLRVFTRHHRPCERVVTAHSGRFSGHYPHFRPVASDVSGGVFAGAAF